MPEWAQLVVGAAAIITALGVLWQKVMKPGARLISTTEEMLPLLRTLTTTFRDTPDSLKVLNEIAKQFKTNAGSSLRDVVNRLEEMVVDTKGLLELAASELRQSDATLKVGVETTRQLAAIDREAQRQLMLDINRINLQIAELAAKGATERAGIADKLKTREALVDAATDVVATDLAASQDRAQRIGLTTGGSGPGAAADAAALPSTVEERKAQRRAVEEARRAQWEIDQENDQDEESPT